VVLLCSDGLTTMVAESDIAQSLERAPDAAAAASDLVRLALAGGGEDNVTAVVFRIGEAREVERRDEGVTRLLPVDAHDPAREAATGRLPRLRVALGIVAGLLALAALVVGAVAGLRASHFIGADEESGRVQIYQGVPVELYGDVKLYRAVYRSPVAYNVLDAATRARLFDHTLRSEDEARRVVRELERRTP
jgi:protein phosphatase